MATWIPNQPVFFGELNSNCSCDPLTGAQLVDNTDTTQFQFEIEPCDGAENLIVDENFNDQGDWTLGDNWTIAYNQLCFTPGLISGYGIVDSIFAFDTDKYYKITITVDSIVGTFDVYLGTNKIGVIPASGTYSFYGFPIIGSGDAPLQIVNNSEEASICISEITGYEILRDFKFAIYDATTNGYVGIISYQNTPDYFNFAENTVTVDVIWSELGLNNGCFYICLLDPCENTNNQNLPVTIVNPEFTINANGWTLGDSWNWSSGGVNFSGLSESESDKELYQSIFPELGHSYTIIIDVTSVTEGFSVYFGDSLIETITTAGIHEITGAPTGNLNLLLITGSPASNGAINSITAPNAAFYNYTCNSQSNTFKLADYSDSCTMLVNGCNNEDGLGFVFSGSNFSPRLRIEAKLKKPKYDSERNIYEDSLGEKGSFYFKRRKAKYLCVGLQPEYIHDFLSLSLGFDNFFIDGIAYFVEDDEYDVEYSDASDDLGQVKILVSVKTQNVVNINCSGEINNCNLE